MKIRTRLRLNSYLSVGVALLTILFFGWSLREASKADENERLAVEMRKTALERTVLRDEYLLNYAERARIQWEAKTDGLRGLLEQAYKSFTKAPDKAVLDEIRKDLESTVSIFHEIVANHKRERGVGIEKNSSTEGEMRRRGLIFLKAYSLHGGIGRLHKSAERASTTAHKKIVLFLIIFIALVVVATVGNSAIVNGILTRRIAKLREGTEIIGAGNLDYRIEAEGDDELSDLARASNEMAGKIKTFQLSLEKEVVERKRTEEEIRKLNEDLKDNVLLLEAANKELEAFSYSVSHDLRAPLRHLIGFVELLNKKAPESLDEKSSHYLKVISDSAQQMGRLVDDLLSFSRMGRTEMTKKPVNLDHLAKEVLKELQIDMKGRDIRWKIDPFPVVYGDSSMLRLVFVNLIHNAIKFTRPRAETKIEIGCISDNPEEKVFFVKDNGVGFDMRYVDKLFGLFQRLHRTEEFEGTGVGLANVQRIIHRHGGRTWAESSPAGGATFYFSLPETNSDQRSAAV